MTYNPWFTLTTWNYIVSFTCTSIFQCREHEVTILVGNTYKVYRIAPGDFDNYKQYLRDQLNKTELQQL